MGWARVMLGRRRLMAAGASFACGLADAKAEGKRIALVIGNGDYAQVPKLPNAVNDARAMAAELELPSHDFRVIYGHDLPRASMWARINDFAEAAHRYDVALFYFAGHGVQINNANWLVPTDVAGDLQRGADVEDQSVSMVKVADMMAGANPNGVNMLIIDACRDNPFVGNGRTTGAARGLATTEAANGAMILYSAGSGQTALDGLTQSESHGLFTRELLEAMRRPGVPVSQMMADLQDDVQKLANTVHHLQTPAFYAEQGSNFMFTPSAPLPGATRPPTDTRTSDSPPMPPQSSPDLVRPVESPRPQVAAKLPAQVVPAPAPVLHANKQPHGLYDPDKACTSLGTC